MQIDKNSHKLLKYVYTHTDCTCSDIEKLLSCDDLTQNEDFQHLFKEGYIDTPSLFHVSNKVAISRKGRLYIETASSSSLKSNLTLLFSALAAIAALYTAFFK